MRTEIYINAKDQIVEERQALSKHPDGNAQQRKKAVRSGWQPSWRTTEKRIVDRGSMNPPQTEEGIAIRIENENVARQFSIFASIAVGVIEDQIMEFAITPAPSTSCILCGCSIQPENQFATQFNAEETHRDSIGE